MGNYRLIVMSNDALVYEDLEILREMPTFKQFYPHMAMVRGMRTIYPSVTYPVHCSIASGCYPDKTGVITNEKVIPGQRICSMLRTGRAGRRRRCSGRAPAITRRSIT